MAYKYLQETTDWSQSEVNIPNHTYIFDNSVCVGYVKSSSNEKIMFKTPLKRFSKSRRTFKNVTRLYK